MYISVSAFEVFMKKYIFKWRQLKRGNQILIPLHMIAVILERIDHRNRIKCQERYRDAIWWSNFSQAVKRNVFSLQEAQTLWALWASLPSNIGCAPMVKAVKLLVRNSSDIILKYSMGPWDSLPLRVKSVSNWLYVWKLFHVSFFHVSTRNAI